MFWFSQEKNMSGISCWSKTILISNDKQVDLSCFSHAVSLFVYSSINGINWLEKEKLWQVCLFVSGSYSKKKKGRKRNRIWEKNRQHHFLFPCFFLSFSKKMKKSSFINECRVICKDFIELDNFIFLSRVWQYHSEIIFADYFSLL